jgi:hypothetical protein
MKEETMAFPIPNAVLEPFIREAVSTAIVSSLGDGAKMIEMAVSRALAVKVNSEGKIDNYDSYNRQLFVEFMAQKKIQEVAKEVINEMAEQMRPNIKKQIEAQLKTKHSLIAKTLVDGMIASLTSTWAVKIEMSK